MTSKDVDIERQVIVVQESKNDERRAVPLVGKSLEALSKHAKIRRIDTSLLFPGESPDQSANFRRAFEEAVERVGIEDFHFHDCGIAAPGISP